MTHRESRPPDAARGGAPLPPASVPGPRNSTPRFKLTLLALATLLVLGTALLGLLCVSRVFDDFTAPMAQGLESKAERSAQQLAAGIAKSLAAGDRDELALRVAPYASDADVAAVVVTDAQGRSIHRAGDGELAGMLAAAPDRGAEQARTLVSWADVAFDGKSVGRVGVAVSKARLVAAEELRVGVLRVGAGVTLVVLILGLGFVNFYVSPLAERVERAIQESEQKKREAVAATRLKSEFLANLSHEIRTPMNAVVGMAQLLQGTELDAQQRRYASAIQSSSDALLALLNDVLDLSKIEAGQLQLREEECDVRRLAEAVTEFIAPAAHAKGVEVTCQIDPEVPRSVRVDRDRLHQVLTTIAGNAVKFTERGHIGLSVRTLSEAEQACTLEFSVSDTGCGIAPEHQALVFGQFSQIDGSLTRRYGGAGLGLALSKRLVELMGGEISLESELGQGSCFRFTVRVDRKAQSSEPRPSFDVRVLVVEPARLTRAALVSLLESWGASVVGAADLDEARRTLAAATLARPVALCLYAHEVAPGRAVEWLERPDGSHPMVVVLRPLGSAADMPEGVPLLDKPVREEELRRVLELATVGKRAQGRKGRLAIEKPARFFPNAPHLLVVEDNVLNQQVLRALLEQLGITCDLCRDGEAALRALEERSYPVVLMDCQMPVLDGYEATRRLRSLGGAVGRTPVIAVTAQAFEGERDRALEAGMDDYLAKPVTLDGLVRTLERYLGPAQLREASSRSDRDDTSRDGALEDSGRTPRTEPAEDGTRASSGDGVQGGASELASSTVASPEAPKSVLEPGFKRSEAVCRLFAKLAPGQVESLREAVANGDREAQKAQAHKLKGSCSAIGASGMAQLCAQLETAREEASTLVRELEDALAAVLEELGQPAAERKSSTVSKVPASRAG